VSESHKVVMTAIMFMLPSNCCCSVSLQFHRYSLSFCCSIIHMLLVVHLDPLRLSTLLIQPLKSYMENGIIVRYHSSVSR
jgi:hypothetical protein